MKKTLSYLAAFGSQTVTNLQGKRAAAERLLERTMKIRNDLGLLSEEYSVKRKIGRKLSSGAVPRRAHKRDHQLPHAQRAGSSAVREGGLTLTSESLPRCDNPILVAFREAKA
ncbi:MAG TPA: hypothetical protein VG206_05535 [Terriglobia bacterium]|nr:hypothetical protein [Terriglobia bacterium]